MIVTGGVAIDPLADTIAAAGDRASELPDAVDQPTEQSNPTKRRRRMSTGNMLFLVLTIALAPLGAIAFGATTRTMLTSDSERALLLEAAASGKADRIAALLDGDAARMAQTLARTSKVEPDAANPAVAGGDAVESIFAEPSSADAAGGTLPEARFASACTAAALAFPGGEGRASAQLVDPMSGADLCVAGVPALASAVGLSRGRVAIEPSGGRIVYALASVGDSGMIVLVYPQSLFEQLVETGSRLPAHRSQLVARDNQAVIVDAIGDVPTLLRLESRAPVGQTGMDLVLATSRSWFNGPELIGLLTPLGMWLLAALLSWLVIDRVLLTPIQRLERSMARYRPGDPLIAPPATLFAAQEVDILRGTIEALANNVAADKQALATALETQRALTREVHHRVKNNLQIIASLISLHSRDARGQDEIAAYRGIQRRVDALAVVHRHLHADTEESGGIALGTMLGELSVGLRHSLANEHGSVGITVNVDPAQASQDVALPVAFFITELVELACLCDATASIAIEMHLRPGNLATLSVQSQGLSGCVDRAGDRFASYERVLTGLSRQLRQPLQHVADSGRYCIDVPVLGVGLATG